MVILSDYVLALKFDVKAFAAIMEVILIIDIILFIVVIVSVIKVNCFHYLNQYLIPLVYRIAPLLIFRGCRKRRLKD
jgi:hypothetical protein